MRENGLFNIIVMKQYIINYIDINERNNNNFKNFYVSWKN